MDFWCNTWLERDRGLVGALDWRFHWLWWCEECKEIRRNSKRIEFRRSKLTEFCAISGTCWQRWVGNCLVCLDVFRRLDIWVCEVNENPAQQLGLKRWLIFGLEKMCDNRIGVDFEWLKHLEIDDWLYDLSKISLSTSRLSTSKGLLRPTCCLHWNRPLWSGRLRVPLEQFSKSLNHIDFRWLQVDH